MWRLARALGLMIGVLASFGCSPGLEGGLETPEALTRAVLAAIAKNDLPGLTALALDEQQFQDQVWPELPASRPERNLPFGYVWTDLRTKSEAGLRGMLGEHGGRTYELVGITFTGGTEQYQTFVVHRNTLLELRDSDGTTRSVRLFGSVIEKGRRFKLFSYVID